MVDEKQQLKDWIHSNMKSEAVSELDLWKEEAAQLLSILPNGDVISKVDPRNAKDRILIQFVGRAYAAAGGFVETPSLSNAQVKDAVQSPAGTVDRILGELRAEHLLASTKRGEQFIPAGRVEAALRHLKRETKT